MIIIIHFVFDTPTQKTEKGVLILLNSISKNMYKLLFNVKEFVVKTF